MDRLELLELAEEILDLHKEDLLVDPFVRIKIEIIEDNFTSKCIQDVSPMSWIIRLNPEKHSDIFDVQYSVIEAILQILFDDFRLAKDSESIKEIQERIIARLTTSFCDVFSANDTDEELDEEDSG